MIKNKLSVNTLNVLTGTSNLWAGWKGSFRHVLKNRLYSIINVLGLATALTCVILVTLFVKHELSYDTFHANAGNIFRVTTTLTNKEGVKETVGSSGQVQGPAFKAAVPEIEDFTRMMNVTFNVSNDKKKLPLPGLYVDTSFLDIFSFPLVHGRATNLLEGNSIVLTETSALKFFGTTDVVGRMLTIEDGSYSEPFSITGVTQNPPSNSSIRFEILVPITFLEKSFKDDNWLSAYLTTFLLLHPSADPGKVISKLPGIFTSQAKDQLATFKRKEGYEPVSEYGLQSLTDIHLNRSGLDKKTSGGDAGGISEGSHLSYSYILLGIVGFILLMACINVINLSIANSLRRAKEVGVRKIAGSTRIQIIFQFFLETVILSLLSFGLAIILSQLLLPLFSGFVGRPLSLSQLFDVRLVLTWILILIVTVTLAGLYPAFLLSRFNAKEVLYNKIKLSGRHWLGKTLVVLQFSLAICLIIATIVYYSQMTFISQKDLGYDPKEIVRVWFPVDNPKQVVGKIRQEFLTNSAITEIATGGDNTTPVLGGFPTSINGKEFRYVLTDIDTAFISMLKIPLLQGRNFSQAFGGDRKKSAIVNESFARAASLENPIGHSFENTWGGTDLLTIVGVVKDYHYGSLKEKIYPQVMILQDDLPFFWLRTQPGKRAQAVAAIERVFKKYAPQHVAQYSFLQDDIASLYRDEERWQQIINYAALLSILICCTGLFGLAHLAAAQRVKEIGVRKVLGASVANIVSLLSRDVAILVLLATVIAFPVSWLVMNNWLQEFAYRVEITGWYFVLAGAAAIFIAVITVSFQALKAALANPVKSLRTE